MQKKIARIQKRIEKIKSELQNIGEMRPGLITRQYKKPKEKKGGFYQISYTHKMKSKTEYVRPEFLNDLRRQVKNYKKFKKLMVEWSNVALEQSRLKIKIAKEKL